MSMVPFVYKETLHVLRDRRMLMVVLLIPVVLMLLFGFAITTEVNNVNVAVCSQNRTDESREAIERLEANPYITFIGCVNATDIYQVMQRGIADATVVIGNDGSYQVITDTSNPNIGQSALSYISAILRNDHAPIPIDTHYLWNPQLKSSYNFVPGIMGMLFLLICALMTAVSIVREKETGTIDLLLVSPVRPITIIVSKMVPFFVLSCIDLTIIIIVARYVLGVPMTGGVLAVIIFSLLYVVLSLVLGLFVSTIAESQISAMLICGMIMIFPVIMLSGMIYPIDNLPIILKQISAIVPARWYIDAMRKLMVEGLSLADVWLDFAVLSGMTVLLLAISLKKFKDRQA